MPKKDTIGDAFFATIMGSILLAFIGQSIAPELGAAISVGFYSALLQLSAVILFTVYLQTNILKNLRKSEFSILSDGFKVSSLGCMVVCLAVVAIEVQSTFFFLLACFTFLWQLFLLFTTHD